MAPTLKIAIPALLIAAGLLGIYYWQTSVNKFVNQGARFTADNGQELCLRIQRLEDATFGQSKPCSYNSK